MDELNIAQTIELEEAEEIFFNEKEAQDELTRYEEAEKATGIFI